jgi:uncharacterized membrane protein
VNARTRVITAALAGLAALGATIAFTPWQVAELAGWDTMAVVFVGTVLVTTWGKSPQETRAIATAEDNSRVAAGTVLIGASVASLAGVVLLLLRAAHENNPAHTLLTALALFSVLLSWTSVHAVFTLRYAHLYYSAGGGIDWHADDMPDYGDFAYVALTVGMTFQVSDTDLQTKLIRKTAVRHALLSYLFGVVVLAAMINVIGSLLAR